jgi:hypothetical protein
VRADPDGRGTPAFDFILANENATSGDIRRLLGSEGHKRPDSADLALAELQRELLVDRGPSGRPTSDVFYLTRAQVARNQWLRNARRIAVEVTKARLTHLEDRVAHEDPVASGTWPPATNAGGSPRACARSIPCTEAWHEQTRVLLRPVCQCANGDVVFAEIDGQPLSAAKSPDETVVRLMTVSAWKANLAAG